MNLHIRNPRARELAEELARRKGTSVSDAVVHALEAELSREAHSRPAPRRDEPDPDRLERIYAIIDRFTKGRKPGRDMTKDEIDAMWGHE